MCSMFNSQISALHADHFCLSMETRWVSGASASESSPSSPTPFLDSPPPSSSHSRLPSHPPVSASLSYPSDFLHLPALFDLLDLDKNGRVHVHEILSFFQKLDICPISDPSWLLSLVRSVNPSPDAVDLDFSHFQAFYTSLFPGEQLETEISKTMRADTPLNPMTFAADHAVDDSAASLVKIGGSRVSAADSNENWQETTKWLRAAATGASSNLENLGRKKEEEEEEGKVLRDSNSRTEEEEMKHEEEGKDEDDIVQAFKVYDANGDGFICAIELAIVLQKLGLLPVSEEPSHYVDTCQAFIDSVDEDGDGLVSLQEFKAMLDVHAQAALETPSSAIATTANYTNTTMTMSKAGVADSEKSVSEVAASFSKMLQVSGIFSMMSALTILPLYRRFLPTRFTSAGRA